MYPDRILVTGKEYLGADYSSEIVFENMRPEIESLKVRPNTFGTGIWFIVGGGFGWTVLVHMMKRSSWDELSMTMWAIVFAGVAIVAGTWKKQEYVVFRSDAGVPVLSLAKEGPDKKKFSEFVDSIVQQIREIRDV